MHFHNTNNSNNFIMKKKILFLFLIFILFLFGCLKNKNKPNVEITVLDVGQGDAILISFPGNKHILIDTGDGGNSYKQTDAGRDVIVPFLKNKGISFLDYLILTHPHNDHIGGCKEVLYEIKVGEIFICGKASNSSIYLDLLRFIKEKEIPLKIISRGDKILFSNLNNLDIEFLHPDNVENYTNLNNVSIVTYLKYGNVSALLMGDAEAEAEASIMNEYTNLNADIIKVGHHGSETSSSDRFVNMIKPKVAIISCAEKNKFGHPARKTIKKYERINCKIYRTYINGHITVKIDGDSYKVSCEKK